MMFTIFTPTYNRAHTLPRVYESIRRQTRRDFEWVIVDDGSTDGTGTLVRQWQQEANDFPIRYFWQPNQHKKAAFNRGVREAKGRWFVPIDSDDELLPDALEQFARLWGSIAPEEYDKYAGVMGLCIDSLGEIVGDPFPQDPLDATSVELVFDYQVTGEKFSCMRTDVLREYPFPEDIPNFVPEGVVWFRISRRYTQRCSNVPVRVYHRDVESLTQPGNALQAKVRNAEGALLCCAEALDWVTWRRFVRAPFRIFLLATQFGRWAAYLPPQRRRFQPRRLGPRLLTWLMRPAGWFVYALDKAQLTASTKPAMERMGLRVW